jgi:ABC-type arginine/histidine transport system permease subunit
LLQPWFTWAVGTITVVQAWAFVSNVIGDQWILAVCFGLATVVFVILTVVLLRLRKRAKRQPARGSMDRQP